MDTLISANIFGYLSLCFPVGKWHEHTHTHHSSFDLNFPFGLKWFSWVNMHAIETCRCFTTLQGSMQPDKRSKKHRHPPIRVHDRHTNCNLIPGPPTIYEVHPISQSTLAPRYRLNQSAYESVTVSQSIKVVEAPSNLLVERTSLASMARSRISVHVLFAIAPCVVCWPPMSLHSVAQAAVLAQDTHASF